MTVAAEKTPVEACLFLQRMISAAETETENTQQSVVTATANNLELNKEKPINRNYIFHRLGPNGEASGGRRGGSCEQTSV